MGFLEISNPKTQGPRVISDKPRGLASLRKPARNRAIVQNLLNFDEILNVPDLQVLQLALIYASIIRSLSTFVICVP